MNVHATVMSHHVIAPERIVVKDWECSFNGKKVDKENCYRDGSRTQQKLVQNTLRYVI